MLLLHQLSRHALLNRTVVAGLAACALAPAGAVAMPDYAGPPPPDKAVTLDTPGGTLNDQPGGRFGPSNRASDVDATLPVPLPVPQITTVQKDLPRSNQVADDGVDTEVWIAAGAAGILLASGIGMVTRVRVRRHSTA